MNPLASSQESISLTKPTFACIRCSDRKVRCNKQNPCNSCVRHNVQCVFRPRKQPRKKRNFVENELVEERLQHYEALLREKGIDPGTIPEIRPRATSARPEIRKFPLPAPTRPEQQATVFKPQLLHGHGGTKFVGK
jgi:hypothetical protein